MNETEKSRDEMINGRLRKDGGEKRDTSKRRKKGSQKERQPPNAERRTAQRSKAAREVK
jgi:hypothetical protein